MQRKPILIAAGAAVLAIAVFAGCFVLAATTNSGGNSASNAMANSTSGSSSSGSGGAVKTTPAQCWDDYGPAETALANTLSQSVWKQVKQDGKGMSMSLTGTTATIVSTSGSASEKAFGLKDAKSETVQADGTTITRTTATAVDSDGKEYALTLDTSAEGSVLVCSLFGDSAWNPSGNAGEPIIGEVSDTMNSLIGGNGQKMREAVSAYLKENVPLAVSATCVTTATVDTSKNMAYVTWAVSAPNAATLSADVNLATGEVSVEKLES